jgi:hypothetical protein
MTATAYWGLGRTLPLPFPSDEVPASSYLPGLASAECHILPFVAHIKN